MNLITEGYRAANEHLHATTDFGVTAPRYFTPISNVAHVYRAATVLDYGSGRKRWVEQILPGRTVSYDPCVPSLSRLPEPADLLISCDVLEHIEPELLDNVLDHMASLTLKAAFVTIAMRPAKKVLPDGRNAHLIIEDIEFWLPRLWARWRIRHVVDQAAELIVTMEAKPC